MEAKLKAYIFRSPEDTEEILIQVTSDNYLLVREKLKLEKNKIVDYFNRLKSDGLIKVIRKPKNKKMQKQLDKLVAVKKQINKTILDINTLFK